MRLVTSHASLQPHGSVLEGKGITPDLVVETNLAQLAKRDAVLDEAIKLLGAAK